MDIIRGMAAVVTGGGAGIGREICLSLAGEGMNVVVADLDEGRARDVAGEVEAKGVKALAVACNVGDAAAVEALADKAYGAFGAVNVLCNNAGVVQFGPVSEAPQDDWEWLFKANLWGVVNGIRTFVPRMKAQGQPAHIVNTASLSGIFAVPGLGVYTASKYAVVGITETMRMELKPYGIGASVLCPGPTPSRIGETARLRTIAGAPALDPQDADLSYLGWQEPSVVARCVRDGIKANRLYLFTTAPGRIATEKRFNAMLRDFEAAPQPSEAARPKRG